MSTGMLFDCDREVAKYLFDLYKWPDLKYDRAIGLLSPVGVLVGAVIFHSWNGNNVEIAYYGKSTMTLGIVRSLCRFALLQFDPSRVTAVTSKRNKPLIRGLMKIGFKFEGVQRCYYGKKDCNRNTGVRLVLFRETVEKLARFPKETTHHDRNAGERTTR